MTWIKKPGPAKAPGNVQTLSELLEGEQDKTDNKNKTKRQKMM